MPEEKKISDVLSYIVSALSNCALYSPVHPAVEEFSRKAFFLMQDLFIEDSLTLTLLSNSFIFNETPVSDTGVHISTFVKKLRAKGIERVVIKKAVTLEEFKPFIAALASRDGTVPSSRNIAVGMLEVRFKPEGDLAGIIDKNVVKVKEVYEGVSRFQRLDIRGIEDVVVGFISALKKEANVLQNLSPVKSHSAYTYVHEANVSVLTIFQAEALGLSGETLHDAGLAGLMHDVGKLFVSKEIVEKKARLEAPEWDAIKLHPIYGAIYLSTLPEVPRLAVIAAYEHHMKYDGSGYPQNKKIKKQHLISQLVAISDFFDALRTERAYRPSFEVPVITELLLKGSGKDFSPELVNNFITAIKKIDVL